MPIKEDYLKFFLFISRDFENLEKSITFYEYNVSSKILYAY